METNVCSADHETKDLTLKLLYGREISVHMANEISASLLTKVAAKAMLSTTKEWFSKSFSTEEGMKVFLVWVYTVIVYTHTILQANTQAHRNFLFSAGYNADTAIELTFSNMKGHSADRCVCMCVVVCACACVFYLSTGPN
jgi:hypothetical protein